MRIVCRYCQKQYSLRDESVGEHFRCRACGKLSPVSRADAGQPVQTQSSPPPSRPVVTQPASRNSAIGRAATAPTANARPATHIMSGAPPAEPVGARWPIDCQFCGRRHTVRAEMAGMQFCCKGCGKLNPVLPPQHASDEQASVLVATPVAPKATLPTAQVVYVDDNDAPAAALDDDLLLELPTASVARAAPLARSVAAPSPANRKKKKRPASGIDVSRVAVRVVFGCITAVIGAAIIVWGIYSILNPDSQVRRPGRAIGLGALFVGAGTKWIMGKSFTKG